MVLYGVNLSPLVEELQAVEPELISHLYGYDAAFDVSSRRSMQLLNLLLDWELERGYFYDPDKLLFIINTPTQKEATRCGFV